MASGIALSWMKVDLAVEDVFGIVVESDDEPGHHFHAVTLNAPDAIEQAAARVLHLLGFLEALLGGRFDAQEDAIEAGVLHHLREVSASSARFTEASV